MSTSGLLYRSLRVPPLEEASRDAGGALSILPSDRDIASSHDVVEIHDERRWERFCSSATPSTFLQSWSWGEVQKSLGRKIWRLGVFQDGTLVAIGLLVKLESRLADHLYCPRGPVCDWTDLSVLDAYLSRAVEIARAERCAFIRVEPLLSESGANRRLFANRGFVSAVTWIQPENVRLLSLGQSEEELLADMRETTRRHVRHEPKRGVTVQISDRAEDALVFVELYNAAARRKGFVNHRREYYLKQFEILSRDGIERLFIARHGDELLSMAMVVYYGGRGYYLYGASNPISGGSRGHLLQWEAIKEAKRRGCRYYNLLGIVAADLPSHPWYGFTVFKRGFGGFDRTYLRAQDLPLSPRYWLYRYAEKSRRLLRGASRRIKR